MAAEVESKWYRGEGGGLHRFDLPMRPEFASQVEKGLLIEVSGPDGDAVVAEPVPDEVADVEIHDQPRAEPLARPADSAPVATWRAYAMETSFSDASEVDAMTKAQLIAKFG